MYEMSEKCESVKPYNFHPKCKYIRPQHWPVALSSSRMGGKTAGDWFFMRHRLIQFSNEEK